MQPTGATAPSEATPADWASLSAEEVRARLGAGPDGLDDDEVARRRQRHGANVLPEAPRRGWLGRFLSQFNNLLIYVLIAASVVTALLGHWIDAAVIAAVVIANAIVGTVQEGQAERALDAVARLVPARALALRAGHRLTVPAAELVPGDTILLEAGDRVPADARLVAARELSVDESMLTGESIPASKQALPVAASLPVADRSSMVYSGTTVTGGQATALVVATGPSSEVGRIGHLVAGIGETATPLLRRLSDAARLMTYVILAFAVLTFAAGWLISALTTDELFLTAIGLAVAAIPEGLPAIVTIILAIGVRSMARRGALVRRLPAVETLGSVTIICTDKTGTLTRNEQVAREVVVAGGRFLVDGEGYSPDGAITDESGEAVTAGDAPLLADLALAAALCNEAALRHGDDGWHAEGDPLEAGLLALAMKAGFDPAALAEQHPRLDALPFSSDHRYMATLHEDGTHTLLLAKGAPERLVEICTVQRGADGLQPIDRAGWLARSEAMAANGLRVLAFASVSGSDARSLSHDGFGNGLAFLGLVGFIDPARSDAAPAVAQCRSAGIAVKMITGDHPATALAVARAIGLDTAGGALTGADLAALDAAGLGDAAERVNVFARVSPEQKLSLVEALQARGHSVAMTGDGVNDAPALRKADIGVAMSRRGSDAARQAAEMVLVDDNFATIAHAVAEGRRVDDNLRKALGFILPTNAGEALVLMAAVLVGAALPVTALQIIWINFATEVTLSLSLAFEPAATNVMHRPPRRGVPLLGRRDLARIAVVGCAMAALATALFHLALGRGEAIEVARALAVNSIVAAEAGFLLAVTTIARRGESGRRQTNQVAVAMVIVVTLLQLAVTQWPAAAAIFAMAPLGVIDWLLVAGSGVLVWAAARAAAYLLPAGDRSRSAIPATSDRR